MEDFEIVVPLECSSCKSKGAFIKEFWVTIGKTAKTSDVSFYCKCKCGHIGNYSFTRVVGDAKEGFDGRD